MTWWSVNVELEGDDVGLLTEFAMDELLEYLGDFSPVVIVPPEDPRPGSVRYGVDLSVDATDAPEAANIASSVLGEAIAKLGLPAWPLVKLAVVPQADIDASLTTSNFPLLLGVAEIADVLGVSKQRVSDLARQPSFPRPVANLASGPVWIEPAIRRFVDHWERRPGRPRGAGATVK